MSPPKRPLALLLAVSFVLGFAATLISVSPANAMDYVYHLERQAKMLRNPNDEVIQDVQEQGVLYVAGSKVRFDQGDQVSWILDAGRSELLLVRHDLRRYHVLPIPFELEAFATTAELKTTLEELKSEALVGIEVERKPGTEQIGDFETSRVDVGGHSPDGKSRVEYQLWLSPSVPGETGLYSALLREFGSADLTLRPLARKMAELPGFPVLRRSVAFFPEGRLVDERRLVSVETKELPDSLFAPPAEYRRESFDLRDWLTPK